jgi:hypothetical protein
VASLGAGCDKAKEEPVGNVATVVMPNGPAPTDSNSSPSTSTVTAASTSRDAARAPPAGDDIPAGNRGPLTGGTVSVIAGPPVPAAAATPPTESAPASPLDPSVLPPAIAASRALGAGAIGPAASAPADAQPLSVPPGSKS